VGLKLCFLIVDDHPDGRFLVAKTLLRKFPHSTVLECQTAEAAFEALERKIPSFIVAHRTFELDGISLLRELRSRAPDIPILMTSGIDRSDEAVSAGADGFATYDEWLMIGSRVLELLAKRRAATNVPFR
jgi:two-component system response regulator FlrC